MTVNEKAERLTQLLDHDLSGATTLVDNEPPKKLETDTKQPPTAPGQQPQQKKMNPPRKKKKKNHQKKLSPSCLTVPMQVNGLIRLPLFLIIPWQATGCLSTAHIAPANQSQIWYA